MRKREGDVSEWWVGLVLQCTLCSLPHDRVQPGFFALSFWELLWTKWSSYQHIDINRDFVINFCVGDIQLLFNHKIPKIWTCLPFCLHFLNFGIILPFFERCKLNLNTHPPPLPLPPSPLLLISLAVINYCKKHKCSKNVPQVHLNTNAFIY